MSIQQHPAYHEGFFDALDGEPLFENECAPEYKAGWLAYWKCKDLLADPGALVRTGLLPDDSEAGECQFRELLH